MSGWPKPARDSHECCFNAGLGAVHSAEAAGWEHITEFVHRHGAAEAKIGAQLAHAGRKASAYWPFSGKRGSVPASGGDWESALPGYQTGFAARIRRETGVPTGTVGLLTSAGQAEHAVATGQADGVFIARAALRDPHWWLRAAFELGHTLKWAPQYERAVVRHAF